MTVDEPFSDDIRTPDLGVYAQDQWTIRRVTLAASPAQHVYVYTPEYHQEFVCGRANFAASTAPNWTTSSRECAAWDLFGNVDGGEGALQSVVGMSGA